MKVSARSIGAPDKSIPANAVKEGVKLLLEVGAEGGSLAIYGKSGPAESRKYRFGLVDSTLEMLGEEEGSPTIRRRSGWLDSWDAAIEAMSVYPWPSLYPMFVAPDVSAAVWNTLQAYREDSPENRTLNRSCHVGDGRGGDLVQSRAGYKQVSAAWTTHNTARGLSTPECQNL